MRWEIASARPPNTMVFREPPPALMAINAASREWNGKKNRGCGPHASQKQEHHPAGQNQAGRSFMKQIVGA